MIYAEFFYLNPSAPAGTREARAARTARVWIGAPSTPSADLHARGAREAHKHGYPLYRLVRVQPHLRKGEHASAITRARQTEGATV